MTAHTVAALYYLLANHCDRTTARRKTRLLLRLPETIPVDEDRLLQALDLSTPDFEDAVRVARAETAGADVVVTRDAGDFRVTDLAVRSPRELPAGPGDVDAGGALAP